MYLKSINLNFYQIMRKINRENILNRLILIFAIFPIIPNTLKGLPVILLFAGALFFFNKRVINWKWLLINSSLFLVYVVSVLYSNDHSVALKKLETSLSIIVMPIIFFALLPHPKTSNILKGVFIKIFISSTAVFSMYSFIFILLRSSSLNHLWDTDKYRNIIIDMPLVGQHPIYASIFLALSIMFFVFLLKQKLFINHKEKFFF